MGSISKSIKEKVIEQLIAQYQNISITTTAKQIDGSSWHNGDFAYNSLLVPILLKATEIKLFNYHNNWQNEIPAGAVPQWLKFLDNLIDHSTITNSIASIKPEDAVQQGLKDFWFSRIIIWKDNEKPFSTEKKTIRICMPVITISAANFPKEIFNSMPKNEFWGVNVFKNFFGFSEPSAKRWVEKSRGLKSDILYIPHLQLESIKITGDESTLMNFYKDTFSKIEFPDHDDEFYKPLAGESVDDCVLRLIGAKR
jgi:hypothetical protein